MEKTPMSYMKSPYSQILKEDREAHYDRTIFKNLPLLIVATLVALPIAFFILMHIVNTLVEITAKINNL